jgi:hypothetical protein
MIGNLDAGRYSLDQSFVLAASAGIIKGISRISQQGNAIDIAKADTPADVWSGAVLGTLNGIDHHKVQIPQAAVAMELWCANAADTAAGAGVRSVQVVYLDALYVQKSVVLSTNGTTPVPLPETAVAINALIRVSVGAFGVANAGPIHVRAAGGNGATFAYMATGKGVSHSSLYTVPDAHTLLIAGVTYSVNRSNSDIWADFSVSAITGSSGAYVASATTSVSSGGAYRASGGVLIGVATQRSRIWTTVESVSANTGTNATSFLYGLVIPNSKLVPQ